MGFIRSVIKKVTGPEKSPYEKAQDIKTRQEIFEERQRGFREGSKKRAYEEGKRAGMGKSGSGIGGLANAVGSSLNNAEKMFGFSGGSMGGMDFGLGLSQPKQRPRQKVTKVISGGKTITIRDSTEREEGLPKRRQASPYDWMHNSHNFFDMDE